MPTRRHVLALGAAATVLAACGRDDPQAALEAAVQQLQDHLEAKDAGAVLDLLDAQFRAQDDLNREWARRTMGLLFLRHANVRIVALTRTSRIAPDARHVGFTEAQVLLSGAQDLIPDRVAPYSIKLEWRHDGSRWKLFALDWQ
jgi:hypothetical protein